jgi:hypothetical protein
MKYKNDKGKKADWMVHGNRKKTKQVGFPTGRTRLLLRHNYANHKHICAKNGQVVDQIHFLENSNSDYDRHMFLMLQ